MYLLSIVIIMAFIIIALMQEEAETIDQQCHVLREMPGARRLLVGVETVDNSIKCDVYFDESNDDDDGDDDDDDDNDDDDDDDDDAG